MKFLLTQIEIFFETCNISATERDFWRLFANSGKARWTPEGPSHRPTGLGGVRPTLLYYSVDPPPWPWQRGGRHFGYHSGRGCHGSGACCHGNRLGCHGNIGDSAPCKQASITWHVTHVISIGDLLWLVQNPYIPILFYFLMPTDFRDILWLRAQIKA